MHFSLIPVTIKKKLKAVLLAFRVTVLIAACTCALAAQDPKAPTWDLSAEFPSLVEWNRSLDEIHLQLSKFAKRRGELVNNGTKLAELLDQSRDLRGRAGRMARYALLTSLLDTTDTEAKARLDAATTLEGSVEAGVSWLDSAIEDLGTAKVKAWQRQVPRLRMHGWQFATLLSQSDHRFPRGAEAAYATLEGQASKFSRVYEDLMQSDLGWPSATGEADKSVRLDPSTFARLSTTPDTTVRRQVTEAYYGHLQKLQQPLGDLLIRRYEIDHELAVSRNYLNGIDAAFSTGDGVPVGTYKEMIRSARANTKTLQRFVDMVARMNRITEIRYDDLLAPAPPYPRQVTLVDAQDLAVKSAAPLGPEYQEDLRQMWTKPFFDLAPRPHKDDGVGLYWQVGGGHPYGVMVYNDTLGNARTLTAMGALAMFYTRMPPQKLPTRREQDFPIYGNAVWFMAPILQTDYLLGQATDKQERIALLGSDLRRTWSNFYPNVIATDFEDRLEAAIASGRTPSGPQVSQLYLSVLHDYYGETTLSLPAFEGCEWMTLGNMYYGHVKDEWAFAMAAAASMVENVMKHDPSTLSAVRAPMGRERSYLSFDLMRDANADPTNPETYAAIYRRMNTDMDKLDELLR